MKPLSITNIHKAFHKYHSDFVTAVQKYHTAVRSVQVGQAVPHRSEVGQAVPHRAHRTRS